MDTATEQKNRHSNFFTVNRDAFATERMMSVYPTSKGFGYLIFESAENIID
jgi:hypothetical protein